MRIFYYNLQCEAFQVEKGMNFMLAFEKNFLAAVFRGLAAEK